MRKTSGSGQRTADNNVIGRSACLLIDLSLMPWSHIHESPRQFHYRSNLRDDPGNVIFRSQIQVHNGVAMDFGVSTKDKIEKDPFGDMIGTVC